MTFQQHGIIYIKNAYDDNTFNLIKRKLKQYNKYLSCDNRINGRKTVCINKSHEINNLIYNPKFLKSLENKLGDLKLKKTSYPIEYRKYFTGSTGMRWHKDKPLFTHPQLELVLTIENTSDSATKWKEKSGKIHSIKTKENSVIVVQANSIFHKVNKVTSGERFIVKYILFDKKLQQIKNEHYNYEFKNCKIK